VVSAVRVAPAPAPQVAPVAPLQGATHSVLKGEARIVSGYGDRTDPVSGETAVHNGVDLAQAFGSPVYAPMSGTVTFAGTRGTLGRMVEITAAGGYVLRLGHLNTVAVKTGDKIAAAAEIGSMGSSGSGKGSHVHVEVERNGKTVDPMTVPGLVLAALETAPSLTPIRYQTSPAAPPSPPSPPSAASPPAAPAPLSPPAAASPPSPASPPAAAAPPAPYAPYASPAAMSPPAPPTPTTYTPVAPEVEYWKPLPRLRVEPGVAGGGANVVKVRQEAQLDRVPVVFVLSDSKPVIKDKARPTSGFGFRPDPTTGREAFHAGVDVGAAIGTPVHAPTAGRITFTGEKASCGRVAELTLANGAVMRFCRLDSIAVSTGYEVTAGTQIGTVGTDAESTGPHLHFEVIRDGKAINPASVGNLVMIGAHLAN
jgi:murein DD-endopeptidase MepM/ murein hydrolase activator NlpD